MAKSKSKAKTQEVDENDCFVIMPISDPDGYDKGHFRRVYEDIFTPACAEAGLNPVRADDVVQSNLIQVDMLERLVHSPMCLCDLSAHNPNVMFELGIRQAFNMPVTLVQEEGTGRIFDISVLRYTEYDPTLDYRMVLTAQKAIADALHTTRQAADKKQGVNSLIDLLSVNAAQLDEAAAGSPTAMFEVLQSELASIRRDLATRRQPPRRSDTAEAAANATQLIQLLLSRANDLIHSSSDNVSLLDAAASRVREIEAAPAINDLARYHLSKCRSFLDGAKAAFEGDDMVAFDSHIEAAQLQLSAVRQSLH